MVRVAITGEPGSGKSTVRLLFENLGAYGIDLDSLSREVVQPGSPAFREIVATFGEEVVAPNGTLDRRRLRNIILGDARRKKILEDVTHPAIRNLLKTRLADIESQSEAPVVVVEVPLLVEAGLHDDFDIVVLVESKPEVQKNRIMERDLCSEQEAEALIGLHLPAKEKRSHAHYMVENSGAINDTKACVERIFFKIMGDVSKTLTV